MGDWVIELHSSVEVWFLGLVEEDPETADLVEEAIEMLAATGPALGALSSIGSRDRLTTTLRSFGLPPREGLK